MNVAHQLRVSGQAPTLRKGQIKNISIEVQKRMNNKWVKLFFSFIINVFHLFFNEDLSTIIINIDSYFS